jgi:hypothetical protein
MAYLTQDVKDLIEIYKNRDTGFIPVSEQLLLELAERIEFLEARQTELQEEGTRLVTERRELKAEIEKIRDLL